MNADVNIPNSSENATLQDDSQKVNSSAKRGIADENPTADVYVSLNHSSGQIGNAEHFLFFMHFFSGTKHPREDNPNLYYWAEMTGLHTQTFNI